MKMVDLLAPRFKVIDKYPGMEVEPFHLGQIITLTMHESDGWIHIPVKHIPGSYMRIGFFTNSPNLFQPLHWADERKIEDMPEYVKVISEDCAKDTGIYCKVYRWSEIDNVLPNLKGQLGAEIEEYQPDYLIRTEFNFPGQVYGRLIATHLLPATKEEYEAYVNQLKDGQ